MLFAIGHPRSTRVQFGHLEPYHVGAAAFCKYNTATMTQLRRCIGKPQAWLHPIKQWPSQQTWWRWLKGDAFWATKAVEHHSWVEEGVGRADVANSGACGLQVGIPWLQWQGCQGVVSTPRCHKSTSGVCVWLQETSWWNPGVSGSGFSVPLTSMDTSEGTEQRCELEEFRAKLALERHLHRRTQDELLKAQQALLHECSWVVPFSPSRHVLFTD